MAAIERNEKCVTGIAINPWVVATGHGPSGGPELVAYLCNDMAANSWGVGWYGHVMAHPSKPGRWVAMLIPGEQHNTTCITAGNAETLLARYHYFVASRGHGTWCNVSIQNEDDAYQEATSFTDACDALCQIISRFDTALRGPHHPLPEMGLGDIAAHDWSNATFDLRGQTIYARNPGQPGAGDTMPQEGHAAVRPHADIASQPVLLVGQAQLPRTGGGRHA